MGRAIKFYLQEAQAAKGWITLSIFFNFFYVTLQALLPLFFALIADWLTEGNKTFSQFLPLLLLATGSALLMRLSVWPINYATERASIRVQKNIARKIFEHLTWRSLAFYAKRLQGTLVADAGKVARNFETLLVFSTEYVLGTALYLLIMFIILATEMPLFVPVLFLVAIAYIFFSWRVRKTEARPAKDTSQSDSLVSAHLADTLGNIETVIASGSRGQELLFYDDRVGDWEKDAHRLMRKRARNVTILHAAPMLVIAPLLFVGVFLVTEGHLSVGDLLLILLYGQNIISTAGQTNYFFTESFEALSQAEPMVEILQEETEIPDRSNKKIRIERGQIEIEKVSFSYPEQKPLFQDFSLQINSEEKVGLVGPSGAGKSTLMRLLLRMAEPETGRILVDKQNISNYAGDSLRQQISYVGQEPILFHRTIRENIAYGIEASEALLREAVRAASAEFVEELPEGYESRVGDRGIKLSGGERQRIILARAFLRNSPVLLLDEPTSSLDSYSESLVQQSIEKLFHGKTVLVIAHRLSTIAHLDRIVVLDKGRVRESGTHSELLRRGGLYSGLWQKQSEGFLP